MNEQNKTKIDMTMSTTNGSDSRKYKKASLFNGHGKGFFTFEDILYVAQGTTHETTKE